MGEAARGGAMVGQVARGGTMAGEAAAAREMAGEAAAADAPTSRPVTTVTPPLQMHTHTPAHRQSRHLYRYTVTIQLLPKPRFTLLPQMNTHAHTPRQMSVRTTARQKQKPSKQLRVRTTALRLPGVPKEPCLFHKRAPYHPYKRSVRPIIPPKTDILTRLLRSGMPKEP